MSVQFLFLFYGRSVSEKCFKVPKSVLIVLILEIKLASMRAMMDNAQKAAYLQNFNTPFCRDMSEYEKLGKVGQGEYGEVYKARDKRDALRTVAMKKVLIKDQAYGIPITTLREIKLLQQMRHENVVILNDVCIEKPKSPSVLQSTIYLIMEYCDYDLGTIIANKNIKFDLSEVKTITKQMFNGLYYLHFNNIMHRDLKPPNILLTKGGQLKLADFGLATAFSDNQPDKCFSTSVVTMPYRPPELLLGSRHYDTSLDIWSAGCITAELFTRYYILPGRSQQDQLILISKLCGAITDESMPGVEQLPLFNSIELPKHQQRQLVKSLQPIVKDAKACDLLDKLLVLDPMKRLNADGVLNHDFLWTDPMPSNLTRILSLHAEQIRENFRQQVCLKRSYQHGPGSLNNSSSGSGSGSGYRDRIF